MSFWNQSHHQTSTDPAEKNNLPMDSLTLQHILQWKGRLFGQERHNNPTNNHNKVSFHSAKLIIEKNNKNMQEQILSKSATKQWNCILENKWLIPDVPQMKAVALFRLYTGHDCLAVHLHRLYIYIYSSPNCLLSQLSSHSHPEDRLDKTFWGLKGRDEDQSRATSSLATTSHRRRPMNSDWRLGSDKDD